MSVPRKNTQPKTKKSEDQSQQNIEETNQDNEYFTLKFYCITANRPTESEHTLNEGIEPVQRGNAGQGFESSPVEEYVVI